LIDVAELCGRADEKRIPLRIASFSIISALMWLGPRFIWHRSVLRFALIFRHSKA